MILTDADITNVIDNLVANPPNLPTRQFNISGLVYSCDLAEKFIILTKLHYAAYSTDNPNTSMIQKLWVSTRSEIIEYLNKKA